MMRSIFFALLLLAPLISAAQSHLKSAVWRGPDVACGSTIPGRSDDVMPLDGANHWETQNAPPGAGTWPAGYSVSVWKVCVAHGGSFSDPAYAVAGHSPTPGAGVDLSTPWLVGRGVACTDYPAGLPLIVNAGDYFDIHAGCASGSHHVVLQLWYTQP